MIIRNGKAIVCACIMLAGAALQGVSPLAAQEMRDGPPAQRPASVFDGDYLSVGVGAFYGPSYEGSDDYVVFPGAMLRGRVEGITFATQGTGLDVDLIPDDGDADVVLIAGPSVRVRLDRTSRIKDPVVVMLGERDTAVELGGQIGFRVNGLLHGYDQLMLTGTARHDVADAHDGYTIVPTLSYFTPLSRGMAVGLTASAEHVDDRYADTYFSISPAGSAATGGLLPAYTAKGGWKSAGGNIFFALDMDGDITNGGLSLFASGGYSRLLGDFARSPIVADRGDATQWVGILGIGYTF